MDDFAVMKDETYEGYEATAPILQSDSEAEYCVRKIQNWERYKDYWRRFYEKRIEAEMEKADKNIQYQKYLLNQYFASLPHKETKTQESYILPSCQLVQRKACDKMTKGDDNTLLMWLAEREITQYTKRETKETVDWVNLKKRLTIVDGQAYDTQTGELVDGVVVEHHDPEFVVKMTETGEMNDA